MLKQRILTAIIALPIVFLAILYMPAPYFAVIIAALMLYGAWEWSLFIGISDKGFRFIYAVCIAIGIFLAAVIPAIDTLLVAVVMWLWAMIAIIHYQNNGAGAGFQFPGVRSLIGFILLVSTWTGIMTLHIISPTWLLFALLITFAADTGAYFVGRLWGKHPLCSRVSPNKTREGFFGGMIAALIIAAIGGLFFSLTIERYFYLLLISLITAVFSVVGDLCVSLLKRMTGIKDSGKFFPGHGGMLDRLDSVAAAVVIFTLGMML